MARPSSVTQLDPELVEAVERALSRGQTLTSIKDMLDDAGAEHISRSALGRYKKDFEEVVAEQRRIRAMAQEFGAIFADGDDKGAMMTQLMQSIGTKMLLPLAAKSGEDLEDMGALEFSRLAKAVKDLSSTSNLDLAREKMIRDEAALAARDEAAETAETAARSAGVPPEKIDLIKRQIMGIRA